MEGFWPQAHLLSHLRAAAGVRRVQTQGLESLGRTQKFLHINCGIAKKMEAMFAAIEHSK